MTLTISTVCRSAPRDHRNSPCTGCDCPCHHTRIPADFRAQAAAARPHTEEDTPHG